MRDHDAALDQAINEFGAIFGETLVRMIFPRPAVPQVDFAETESRHVTGRLTA